MQFTVSTTAPSVHILLLGLLLDAASGPVFGQSRPEPESKISMVTLYPGSATVERVAAAAPGTRRVTFSCLPRGIDTQSLQVSSDASVRIGELLIRSEDRGNQTACDTYANNAQLKEGEEQLATLQAETDAIELSQNFLRHLVPTSSSTANTPVAAQDAKSVMAMADALRRTTQDALLRINLIKRQRDAIEKQLQPLREEKARLPREAVVNVSVAVDVVKEAEIRLSYQVGNAGWTPSYRGLLDTTAGTVRLERQARVAQATGEDWRGAQLLLSTGQPNRSLTAPAPRPWTLGIAPPPVETSSTTTGYRAKPSPAPAPMAAPASSLAAPRVSFDVSVFENSFATEFKVPNRIDVPSSGERVAISLGQVSSPVRLLARSMPGAADKDAFIFAEMAVPEGVWPRGSIKLYRDGAYVGTDNWNPSEASSNGKTSLSFGRDERILVRAAPQRESNAAAGFAGSRNERRLTHSYTVENLNSRPMTLQVLETAPTSKDEQIRIEARFEPKPLQQDWNKIPGAVLWEQELGARQSQTFQADYTISTPKDARLLEQR